MVNRKKAVEERKKRERRKKDLTVTKGGRGDGTAELMEIHTGGRKKERVKKELVDGLLGMAREARSRGNLTAPKTSQAPKRRPQRIEDEAARSSEKKDRLKKDNEIRAAYRVGAKIDTDARAAPSTIIRGEDATTAMFMKAVFGDDEPVKKAKGGMIGTKRYMNGGMVMSGRGVRDTKMS